MKKKKNKGRGGLEGAKDSGAEIARPLVIRNRSYAGTGDARAVLRIIKNDKDEEK